MFGMLRRRAIGQVRQSRRLVPIEFVAERIHEMLDIGEYCAYRRIIITGRQSRV